MPCNALLNSVVTLSGTTGQPSAVTLPPKVGHLSFASVIPSLSLSGQPFSVPGVLGQASLLSTKPSPSVSGSEGQPPSVPGVFGQASSLSHLDL